MPPVRLLALILSTNNATDRRDAARRTWLAARGRDDAAWSWAHWFVLDGCGNATALHGDELWVARCGGKGWRDLPKKVVGALDWAATHAPSTVEAIFKCDDDSVVHVERLWRWWTDHGRPAYAGLVPPLTARTVIRDWMLIDPLERIMYARKLGCPFWGGGRVEACLPADGTRYSVAPSVWLAPEFPPYAIGGTGYLLTRSAAQSVVGMHCQVEPLGLEDVEVGVAALLANLNPVNVGAQRMVQRSEQDTLSPAARVIRSDKPAISVHKVAVKDVAATFRALRRHKSERCPPPPCTVGVHKATSLEDAEQQCVRARLTRRVRCLAWQFQRYPSDASRAQLAKLLGLDAEEVEDHDVMHSYAPEIASLLWTKVCRRRRPHLDPQTPVVIVDAAEVVSRLADLCVCSNASAQRVQR